MKSSGLLRPVKISFLVTVYRVGCVHSSFDFDESQQASIGNRRFNVVSTVLITYIAGTKPKLRSASMTACIARRSDSSVSNIKSLLADPDSARPFRHPMGQPSRHRARSAVKERASALDQVPEDVFCNLPVRSSARSLAFSELSRALT